MIFLTLFLFRYKNSNLYYSNLFKSLLLVSERICVIAVLLSCYSITRPTVQAWHNHGYCLFHSDFHRATVQMSQPNTSNDAFFEEEAMRLKLAFSNTKEGEGQHLYLRHQLQCMKSLMSRLELPWDQYIPLLYRSFAYYTQWEEAKNVRNRNYRLSTVLMECVTFLSKSGRLIYSMAAYYDKQIKEVDQKIADNK